jgi:hypothetical protein
MVKRSAMMIAAAMLASQPLAAQQAPVPSPDPLPVNTRNDLICFAMFAVMGSGEANEQQRTASTALIGYFLGRLRTQLTTEQIIAEVRTMAADGSLEQGQTSDMQRCRTEALQVGNDLIAVGRAFSDVAAAGRRGRQ